jgi:hypothetical protein
MQSLTSALDGGEWSASHPGRFTPRERAPGTHEFEVKNILMSSHLILIEKWSLKLST